VASIARRRAELARLLWDLSKTALVGGVTGLSAESSRAAGQAPARYEDLCGRYRRAAGIEQIRRDAPGCQPRDAVRLDHVAAYCVRCFGGPVDDQDAEARTGETHCGGYARAAPPATTASKLPVATQRWASPSAHGWTPGVTINAAVTFPERSGRTVRS